MLLLIFPLSPQALKIKHDIRHGSLGLIVAVITCSCRERAHRIIAIGRILMTLTRGRRSGRRWKRRCCRGINSDELSALRSETASTRRAPHALNCAVTQGRRVLTGNHHFHRPTRRTGAGKSRVVSCRWRHASNPDGRRARNRRRRQVHDKNERAAG